MWQAVGDAARSAGRFARRHRRAIVVGGVIGAAACAYHRMIKALEEAEQEHMALVRRTGEEARYRQCLGRTRGECLAALTNFISALRKRLFLAVDVTGPVRELKALRGVGAGGSSGAGGGGGGGGPGTDRPAAGDAAAAEDIESREIKLWDKVKSTALTRLVVSLYAFNALALMLHVQLHILGRLSFEESRELLHGGASPDKSPSAPIANPSPDTRAEHAAGGAAGRVADGGGVDGAGAGLALSMDARYSLLSSTYEHILGNGLRALVTDVERAVSRCTSSWHAHTRQEVALRDLIAVLRRVRREVEGPIGGSHYDGDGYGNAASGGGGGGGDLGRSTGGARRTSLLRYIINPSEDLNGDAASHAGSKFTESGGGSEGGGRGVDDETGGVRRPEAMQGLAGVGDVLDETWDTAESPNFSTALQGCLDTTFGMVYDQIRRKAFRDEGQEAEQSQLQSQQKAYQNNSTTAQDGGNEAAGEGRALIGEEEAAAEEAAAASTDGVEGDGVVPCDAREDADLGEREVTQVLATVISQAKAVANQILDPSTDNKYVQAVAGLPAVQDLCSSVFGSNRIPPLPASQRSPPPPLMTEHGMGALLQQPLFPPDSANFGVDSGVGDEGVNGSARASRHRAR